MRQYYCVIYFIALKDQFWHFETITKSVCVFLCRYINCAKFYEMATATGEGNILAADAEVAALERCLKVLKTAKSDTEIFAALLLVS